MQITLGKSERGFTVDAEQFVARPLSEIFPFYADARNLERITPPMLKFQVLTEGDIDMRPGALIDYKISLRGIPMRWRTEITEWDPPHGFADRQAKGPYRFWIHTHRFEEVDGGTRVLDHVDYGVPGGALVNKLVIAPDVRRIFAYRQEALAKIFP
jgi:ligand-binding SRPBCC domain-containing protein